MPVNQKQDVVLGMDVMVELTHGHVASPRYITDSSRVIPFFEEHLARAVYDSLMLILYK
jgi:hypothetical protein